MVHYGIAVTCCCIYLAQASCWQEGYTEEQCCSEEHGAKGNADCWDDVFTFEKCCPASQVQATFEENVNVSGNSCWDEHFTYDFCCSLEHGPQGNAACWSADYNYASCCFAHGGDNVAPAPWYADFQSGGCNKKAATRFLRAASHYYETGVAQRDLVKLYPLLLGESMLEECPVAALQARLLYTEERASVETLEKTAKLLTHFSLQLLHALRTGRMMVEDVAPLQWQDGMMAVGEALARRNKLARPRNVTIVIAYCRESLDWMHDMLSRSLVSSLGIAMVRKCSGVNAVRALPMRRLWRSVEVVDVEDLPMIADECSAYLGYLQQKYEHLPEYMFFLHGDAPEHIGTQARPNLLDETLRAVVNGLDIPFMYLSSNRLTAKWVPVMMAELWRGIFGSALLPFPGAVNTYCCSHFVVSRERARLRSRHWYRHATSYIMSRDSYSYLPVVGNHPGAGDLGCHLPCQNMMWVWHIIFGEDNSLPHRMLDAKLPFFAKVRGIRTAYIENDGPLRDNA